MAMTIQVTVLWVMAPWSDAVSYQKTTTWIMLVSFL